MLLDLLCGGSGVLVCDCLLGDKGKDDWDNIRLPPHTSIMTSRRIARPLGAFAKEWTCPSVVRLSHSTFRTWNQCTNNIYISRPELLLTRSPKRSLSRHNNAPFRALSVAMSALPPIWSTTRNSCSTACLDCSARPATNWDGQHTRR